MPAFRPVYFLLSNFTKRIKMDAVIKLRPEELTDEFFQQLKLMAKNADKVEIRLNGVDAINNLSEKEIDSRLKNLSEGKTVSFTMEEFEAYAKKIAS
jgi:hypothetical protein